MSKRHNVLPERVSFFISSAEKNWERVEIQNKVFRVTLSLLMTVIWKLYAHMQ